MTRQVAYQWGRPIELGQSRRQLKLAPGCGKHAWGLQGAPAKQAVMFVLLVPECLAATHMFLFHCVVDAGVVLLFAWHAVQAFYPGGWLGSKAVFVFKRG